LSIPRSRLDLLVVPRAVDTINSALRHFKTPSQAPEPYHQDYELPLGESASLLFASFNGTPIVRVLYRQPEPTLPKTSAIAQLALLSLLGLTARAMRVAFWRARGSLTYYLARTRDATRFFLSACHHHSHSFRSKAHQTHSEQATGLFDSPTYRRLPKPKAH